MTTVASARQQRSSASAIVFSPGAHRGNTGHPLCADACQQVPTQATTRVGWRIMAHNQVLRGACRLRKTAKGGFSIPRLAPRQAPSIFFHFLNSSDCHVFRVYEISVVNWRASHSAIADASNRITGKPRHHSSARTASTGYQPDPGQAGQSSARHCSRAQHQTQHHAGIEGTDVQTGSHGVATVDATSKKILCANPDGKRATNSSGRLYGARRQQIACVERLHGD